MVNDKKGGNHKLLNSFNGVHVLFFRDATLVIRIFLPSSLYKPILASINKE